jgi:hypothetical protein
MRHRSIEDVIWDHSIYVIWIKLGINMRFNL